jgi:hypothetical protein
LKNQPVARGRTKLVIPPVFEPTPGIPQKTDSSTVFGRLSLGEGATKRLAALQMARHRMLQNK